MYARVCVYICIYIYILYICMYIYIYIERERDTYFYCDTVSFHDFKSRNFKLRVSNPKSKYVVFLSVLSRISNCQGLGRKNKHEILKTDRSP